MTCLLSRVLYLRLLTRLAQRRSSLSGDGDSIHHGADGRNLILTIQEQPINARKKTETSEKIIPYSRL